jgi:hypothetical protein
MDINQIRSARCDLERELQAMIADRLSRFERETGASIEAVYVGIAEVTQIADLSPKFAVGSVTACIRI